VSYKKALLQTQDISAGGRSFLLRMWEEDLGEVYPGMTRYSVELFEGEKVLSAFRTNSFEYAPTMTYGAKEVAERTFARWEQDLAADFQGFLESITTREFATIHVPPSPQAVVVIQGSPRPGGNCSILASWVADEVQRLGRGVQVVFPHDMDIHPCIGCYQCYNTGACIYEDDMTAILAAVGGCRLLVVCTPVYTNTVPAGTKALLDRFQALHASRTLNQSQVLNASGTICRLPHTRARGILMSVAGRKGKENFTCISRVVGAFFSLLGIGAEEPLLLDGMDEIRDVRTIPGLETMVRESIRNALAKD
jgi:NAD(P)H-dependent FMN reductase